MKPRNAQLATEAIHAENPFVSRDQDSDGMFYYSVKTTGVYCRPSCVAGYARPENVSLHVTCEDAEKAGLRPCIGCNSDQPSLARAVGSHSRAGLQAHGRSRKGAKPKRAGEARGMSTYHFHRMFKAVAGLSPKEYATAQRATQVRN